MTKTVVRRPVATIMIMLVFLTFGGVSVINLPLALMPNMDFPFVLVLTPNMGASPEQNQNTVTEPIEQALATISGVENMMSVSNENSSIVQLAFHHSVNPDMAAMDVREAVDGVRFALPDTAGTPIIMRINMNDMASFMFAVSSESHSLQTIYALMNDEISGRLTRLSGVAQVSVSGGIDSQVRVDLIPEAMAGFGITAAQVSGILGGENTSMPLGSVVDGGTVLTLQLDGRFGDIFDIMTVPIPTATGGVAFLQDIAVVSEVYVDPNSYSFLNGEPAIVVSVNTQADANVVEASAAILSELARIMADFPALNFVVTTDPAEFILQAVGSVADTAIAGILLAILVLYIFLRNLRSTLVVAIAIPVSIIVTFTFMFFGGISLNLMSLGGLTLGIGMLVDNSIVVLESIFRHMSIGEDRARAAINGTREVGMSIIASTLTTVAVFAPVAWLGGMIAQMFNDLALSVVFSLLASLLVAITFVPLACSLFLSPDPKFRRKNFLSRLVADAVEGMGRLVDKLAVVYSHALGWCINRRKRVIAASMFFFIISLVPIVLGLVPMAMFPPADQSMISISASLPQGSQIEEVREVSERIMAELGDIPEIQHFSATAGGGGFLGQGSTSATSVSISLYPMAYRARSSVEVADEIRGRMRFIPGAEITVTAITDMMGGGGGGGPSFSLQGDDLQVLMQVSSDIIALIEENVEGVRDVTSNLEDTVPQATIRIDRMRAASFGLTAGQIMGAVSTGVGGTTATQLVRGGTQTDIRVGFPEDLVGSLSDVESILIPTAMGFPVPLGEIAEIEITESPATIFRQDQVNALLISAQLDGASLGEAAAEIDALIEEYPFPPGVEMFVTGDVEMMNDEMASLMLAFVMAIFLVYAILAAQFESLYYPGMIFMLIPLSISTGVVGLFIMQQYLSMTAALGLIILLGIVVNNGIVLIDYINILRGKGLNLSEAILEACPIRLRAILMTTMTTALGLLPMMLGAQEGSEMMQPLATVVVWGLTMSLLVTLLVLPCIYMVADKISTRIFGERKRFRVIEEV